MCKTEGEVIGRVARSGEGVAWDAEGGATDGNEDVRFEQLFRQAWNYMGLVVCYKKKIEEDLRE